MKFFSNIWTKFILLCLFGVIIGWFARVFYVSYQPSKLVEIRENNAKYHFINPLLLVDSPRAAPEYNSLKNVLSDSATSFINDGSANQVSIYFRDLNSGKWTGVNEDQLYAPSSMLKVAMMIGYLKKADDDPSILQKKIAYKAVIDPGQYYKPEHPLVSGNYSARVLIETMISDSDNSALLSLFNNDSSGFDNVFKNLNLRTPTPDENIDFMSPKIYSSLFRTLYSATYLPKEISEQALQLLTYTNFDKGLVAELPKNITIAHKFGERTTLVNGQATSHELHDCGIIYYPQYPYLLCVMTKGQEFSKLEKVISSISLDTYNYISKNR